MLLNVSKHVCMSSRHCLHVRVRHRFEGRLFCHFCSKFDWQKISKTIDNRSLCGEDDSEKKKKENTHTHKDIHKNKKAIHSRGNAIWWAIKVRERPTFSVSWRVKTAWTGESWFYSFERMRCGFRGYASVHSSIDIQCKISWQICVHNFCHDWILHLFRVKLIENIFVWLRGRQCPACNIQGMILRGGQSE